MAYILVEDFRYGWDTRKSAVTSPPGTLREFKNGHVTRGGEIEKAKAFVEKYSLPAGNTFGLQKLGSAIYVFGSQASPGTIPSGVTYQRLVHPDNSAHMSEVLKTQIVDGKIYVIAKYADGSIFHFYDGALVADWGAGINRAGMLNNSGVASHLAGLINGDVSATVSATVAGNVVTLTGDTVGSAFTISAAAANVEGGTDDQTITVSTPTPAVAGVSEVLSSQTFTITGGTANTPATGTVTLTGGASGSVDSITVNGVSIMSGAEAFDTDLDTTAANVAANITANTSSPNYTATAAGAVVTISAATSAGADPNGFAVVSSATTITTSDANMSGGVTNAVTSVTVDGVEILGSRVNWETSHTVMAANIAAQIDSYTSSPDYDADSNNAVVTVKGAAGSGDSPNGRVVAVTVTGTVTATVQGSGVMAGGVDAVAGQAQVSTVTIGGTFEVGDKFAIVVDGYPYGYQSRPASQGTTLLPFKKKMYSGAAEFLHFSGIDQPTKVSTSDTGAGFINMSNEAEEFEEITALGSYFDKIGIFSERTIQLWNMDPDPANNVQSQIVRNIGTFAADSIQSTPEGDLIFLARSGIRALKARDSSNFASVSEIGTAVDEEVKALLDTLTATQKAAAVSVIEPDDNRYLLALGNKVFTFSFFPGSKVSAWSQYEPSLTFSEFTVIDNSLYARAGDKIYLYGGDAGATYVGANQAVIVLPFLDAKSPATVKQFNGIDVSVEGLWKIEAATDPENPTVYDHIANVQGTTYARQNIPFVGQSTHVALRLTSLDANYGKIGNLAIHYDGVDAG